jgi:hypothetical protein
LDNIPTPAYIRQATRTFQSSFEINNPITLPTHHAIADQLIVKI